ncbi:MAG: hypothetical protein GPOALKHO_001526 [Sodalis sp.]|nr:MAG: hypothetical protein GPOALKHO_001526 [Sodalis sp.]
MPRWRGSADGLFQYKRYRRFRPLRVDGSTAVTDCPLAPLDAAPGFAPFTRKVADAFRRPFDKCKRTASCSSRQSEPLSGLMRLPGASSALI